MGLKFLLLRKCYTEEDPHWSKRLSPDSKSTVKKKGTGGIGYLSLKNDDCDTIGFIDDIGKFKISFYKCGEEIP